MLLVVSLLAIGVLASQLTVEQATTDLQHKDPNVRLRAVQALKEAAYPEAAAPLAAAVVDAEDAIQLEAIAAELNIFLAQKVVPRKRVGLIVEVRSKIAAEVVFSAGPDATGPRPVPIVVLSALRRAARDDNPRVGLEALYAFGALAPGAAGGARRELLRESGPDLAAMIGAADPAFRYAAIRVIGRLFERRPQDEPLDPTVGDAMIAALNDADRSIRGIAMQALGAMRDERAVQSLTDLYNYFGRGDLAEAALDALARIGHASSAPLFAPLVAGKNVALKIIAIEGFARLGDRARLPAIQAALGGERNDTVLLAGGFAASRLADAPIDPLVDALRHQKRRAQARAYLIELAAGRAHLFARHAQDPDARVREDVADVLGLGGAAGDPAALRVVEPLVKDADAQVGAAAARAVARLKTTRE